MELFNVEGQQLPSMFRVQVRAIWEVNGREDEEMAETFRYEPLYQERFQ